LAPVFLPDASLVAVSSLPDVPLDYFSSLLSAPFAPFAPISTLPALPATTLPAAT
jgi:hypothetical protein